jgi:hypothetical protein
MFEHRHWNIFSMKSDRGRIKHEKVVFLFLTTIILFYGNSDAESDKEAYELQDRCHKSAEEWFDKRWGGRTGEVVYSYTNHYNTKLNKCFVLLKITVLLKNKKGHIFITKDLYEINEGKIYAHCVLKGSYKNPTDESLYIMKGNEIDCTVLDINCKSKVEWDALVKPYIEE